MCRFASHITAVAFVALLGAKNTTSLIDSIGPLLTELKPSATFILVDTNTATHCLPVLRAALPVLAKAAVITIPAGEADKSVTSAQRVWQALIDARADRQAVLLNLGGGVVTDLGGFAAGCYKRGIRFINVPTTVLGQVDAALGGKTGVDFGGVKNVVGLFANAEAVVSDPVFLKTLPPREVRSGMAEMYKHALIHSPEHWLELQRTGGDLLAQANVAELIAKSQQIKSDIVAQDPHERGLREALNFGHSIGHAIESILLTSTVPALHGEAIAAGMICEAYLSQHLTGLAQAEVEDIESTLLQVYGKLPLRAHHLATLLALVANDKKNKHGTLRMSLLRRIGEPRLNVAVDASEVEQAVLRYLELDRP